MGMGNFTCLCAAGFILAPLWDRWAAVKAQALHNSQMILNVSATERIPGTMAHPTI